MRRIVDVSFDNVTADVGARVAGAAQLLASLGRNESVAFMAQAINATMGK
ncbi:hypothetical protein MNVM_26940 [Mycobacterium novum]|uniref:Uncharacterized protein n=1 Tax=Mycobacterium novum TaxID=2492438 RepID=A0A7I7JPA8_9MYCO|nr:hypothetical protein MNVM_26940 [Mycobacterium novum]